MKIISIFAVLLISLLLIGCSAQEPLVVEDDTPVVSDTPTGEMDKETQNEFDSVMIDEDDDVELGELI